MIEEKTNLQERIDSGKPILLAEVSPPLDGDPEVVRETARRYKGKIDALGISDNRDRVCMSALAAAVLVKAEEIEPILHVITRDRNRIALRRHSRQEIRRRQRPPKHHRGIQRRKCLVSTRAESVEPLIANETPEKTRKKVLSHRGHREHRD